MIFEAIWFEHITDEQYDALFTEYAEENFNAVKTGRRDDGTHSVECKISFVSDTEESATNYCMQIIGDHEFSLMEKREGKPPRFIFENILYP